MKTFEGYLTQANVQNKNIFEYFSSSAIMVPFTNLNFKKEINKISELNKVAKVKETRTFNFLEYFTNPWLRDVGMEKFFTKNKTFEKFGFDIEEENTEFDPQANKVRIQIVLDVDMHAKYDTKLHNKMEDEFIKHFNKNFKKEILQFYP